MSATTSPAAPRKLPGSLETNRMLDRWLSINRDGTVTVYPGKVEIGQGILTVLVQMVAEELDIAVEDGRCLCGGHALSGRDGREDRPKIFRQSSVRLARERGLGAACAFFHKG